MRALRTAATGLTSNTDTAVVDLDLVGWTFGRLDGFVRLTGGVAPFEGALGAARTARTDRVNRLTNTVGVLLVGGLRKVRALPALLLLLPKNLIKFSEKIDVFSFFIKLTKPMD